MHMRMSMSVVVCLCQCLSGFSADIFVRTYSFSKIMFSHPYSLACPLCKFKISCDTIITQSTIWYIFYAIFPSRSLNTLLLR